MRFTAGHRCGIATSIFLLMAASGCTTTVHLGLKNSEEFPQTANITVKDGKGAVTEQITQRIEPNQLKQVREFDVKSGGGYEIVSSMTGSGIVHRETREVTGKPDPLEVTTELKHQAGEFVNDPGSVYALMLAFKTLCAESGAYPIELDAALRSRVGTLVIVSEVNNKSRELFSLRGDPADLPTSGSAVFATARETGSTVISGSGLLAAKEFVPPFTYWGFSINPIGIYQIGWDFEGFGVITTKGKENNYISHFNELSDQTRSQIMDILLYNKGARLYFISGIYGAKRVQISLREASKVAPGVEVKRDDYLTNKGAYSFASSPQRTKRYHRAVLYFVGEEITLGLTETKATEGVLTLDEKSGPIPLQSTTYSVTAYPTGRSRIFLPDTFNGQPAPPEFEVSAP